jgi:cytochrome c oxidase assembly factor 7
LNTALDIVSDGNVRQVVDEDKPDLLVVEMLDRGCNLGCDDSCYLAGGAYLVGVPGLLEKNVSTAYKYDVKACQLGNKLACANLSGALPMITNGPMSNAFQVRWLQLKINKELSEKSPKLPANT